MVFIIFSVQLRLIMVYCGGGTSADSTHSVIISKDARFSGRALKRSPLPPRMRAIPAMIMPLPMKVNAPRMVLQQLPAAQSIRQKKDATFVGKVSGERMMPKQTKNI